MTGCVKVDLLGDRYVAMLCEESGSPYMAVGDRYTFIDGAITEAKKQAASKGWPYVGLTKQLADTSMTEADWAELARNDRDYRDEMQAGVDWKRDEARGFA